MTVITYVVVTPEHLPSSTAAPASNSSNEWMLESAAQCLSIAFASENQNRCCGVTVSQWLPYARQYLTNRFREGLSMVAIAAPSSSSSSTTPPTVVGILCGEDLARVAGEAKQYTDSGTYLDEWAPIEAIIEDLLPSYHRAYGSLQKKPSPLPPSSSSAPSNSTTGAASSSVDDTKSAAVEEKKKYITPSADHSDITFAAGVHWYISLLAVLPSHSGYGIGRELVQRSIDSIARHHGYLRAMTMASSYASQLLFARCAFGVPHGMIAYSDWTHRHGNGQKTFASIDDASHFTVVSYNLTQPPSTIRVEPIVACGSVPPLRAKPSQ